MVGALLIAWLFIGRILLSRIEKLSNWMRRMADGDLEARVEIGGRDEVADMAAALEVFRRHALEVQRLNLVEKLAEDLQEKNVELERRACGPESGARPDRRQPKAGCAWRTHSGCGPRDQEPAELREELLRSLRRPDRRAFRGLERKWSDVERRRARNWSRRYRKIWRPISSASNLTAREPTASWKTCSG